MNENMKNKTKFNGFIIILILLGYYVSSAQSEITLKQCVEYSLKNNSNIKMANYDVAISDKRIQETVGSYLPNISLSGSMDDNLLIRTTVLPGELVGKPGTFVAIQMGVPYNLGATAQLSQKVYDKSALIDIKTSKINKELSEQTLLKTNELTAYTVSANYYQAMIIQIQIKMLRTKLSSSEESLKSTELLFQNGATKKIEVDKIRVSYNNTKSQLQQAELNYAQALNTLKFQMGMSQDSKIVLADTILSNLINKPKDIENNNYDIENTLDYKMKLTNILIMEQNKKKSLAAFDPVISVYGNIGLNAQRDKFDFFNTLGDWYPNSAIGIQISYPIFTGFQRGSRVEQSELNIEKAKESIAQTEQSFKVDISNYEMKFKNAFDNIKNEKENLDLAESVYNNVKLQYQQGVSSSLDLIQSENSFELAQNTYLNKLFDLFVARLDLEKAQGNLMKFINNLK
jgi:outer membrane protein TolC